MSSVGRIESVESLLIYKSDNNIELEEHVMS